MQTKISGTYPIPYAFFGADGTMLHAPFLRQIDAAVAVVAAGVTALRLGLAPNTDRIPAQTPTPLGLAWARRLAHDPGHMPI